MSPGAFPGPSPSALTPRAGLPPQNPLPCGESLTSFTWLFVTSHEMAPRIISPWLFATGREASRGSVPVTSASGSTPNPGAACWSKGFPGARC